MATIFKSGMHFTYAATCSEIYTTLFLPTLPIK